MDDRPVKVLLVEDDEDDYILTRQLLADSQDVSFTLDWAPSYAQALEMIAAQQHDVYLLDYRLGEGTGLELLREALARGCQAPMILLTGQGDREVDVQALKAG